LNVLVLVTNAVLSLEACFAVVEADERSMTMISMASTRGRPISHVPAIIFTIVDRGAQSTSDYYPMVDLLLASIVAAVVLDDHHGDSDV
jgi:hypothetical protein